MKKVDIKKNTYYDSVQLMIITRNIRLINGIDNVIVCMGTDHNKELLKNIGLFTKQCESANSNDLIIAISGTDNAVNKAIIQLNTDLNNNKKEHKEKILSLKKAIEEKKDINMAIISVPGAFAAIEAEIALNANKHVMLFSDNVPLEQEIQLKNLAKQKKLLMMGPDCGTSIINGYPIGFANKVRKGEIGIIGASGTGIQEVSCLIDRLGFGISQAIGTGGRDLCKEVNGIMFELAMNALANDTCTKVLVLISKPPHPEVAEKIIFNAKLLNKPVVINFLGQTLDDSNNIIFADSLEETAYKACSILNDGKKLNSIVYGIQDEINTEFVSTQKYLRGLYTGGTLCDESINIAQNEFLNVHTNLSFKNTKKLLNPFESKENTFIDLGDDIFTRGKPHPMIDPEVRNQRILKESQDPEVAVILLDYVLGFGSHSDPVGVSIPYINEARKNNKHLCFIASITGTKSDPQNIDDQVQKLTDNNVILASCNTQAAHLAVSIIKEINK